ncbi:hypothetical protein NDU88_003853 [Pleurodeles waltl]|uniref:Uncharacterized protein n=1 Tax=Pleurodeles waltl TaxID=8319 RepID=A0AAV7UGG0_PLEWA|nr:hypothetical protein NDU88_003853 [Pleurodeles waltl]
MPAAGVSHFALAPGERSLCRAFLVPGRLPFICARSPDRALWAGSQLRAQIQLSKEFCRWGVGNGVRRPAGRAPRHPRRIDAPLRERARYYCHRYLPRRGGGEDPLLSAHFHRSCTRQDRPGLRCGAPAPFAARPGGWGRRGSRAPPLVAGGPKGPIQRSDPPVPPVSRGCENADHSGTHPHLPPILFAGSRFVGRLFYAVGVLRSGRRGFSHDQQRFGCSLVPGSSRGPAQMQLKACVGVMKGAWPHLEARFSYRKQGVAQAHYCRHRKRGEHHSMVGDESRKAEVESAENEQ